MVQSKCQTIHGGSSLSDRFQRYFGRLFLIQTIDGPGSAALTLIFHACFCILAMFSRQCDCLIARETITKLSSNQFPELFMIRLEFSILQNW